MPVYRGVNLFTVLVISAGLFVAQAKTLAADCTFGKVETIEGQRMSATLIGKLPEYKHMSHSCVVRTDGLNNQNHFFQLKAKRNIESEGENTFCVPCKLNLVAEIHFLCVTFISDWIIVFKFIYEMRRGCDTTIRSSNMFCLKLRERICEEKRTLPRYTETLQHITLSTFQHPT